VIVTVMIMRNNEIQSFFDKLNGVKNADKIIKLSKLSNKLSNEMINYLRLMREKSIIMVKDRTDDNDLLWD